ncbi:MAG: hypothetical protein WCC50_07795, partial [Pseudolabrys sp.]
HGRVKPGPDEGEARPPGSSIPGTGDKEDGLNAELQGDREPALVTMKKEECGGSGQTRIT